LNHFISIKLKFNIFGSDTIEWLVINYSDKPQVKVEVNMFASQPYINGIVRHLEENQSE
jgi:hypothetical protein